MTIDDPSHLSPPAPATACEEAGPDTTSRHPACGRPPTGLAARDAVASGRFARPACAGAGLAARHATTPAGDRRTLAEPATTARTDAQLGGLAPYAANTRAQRQTPASPRTVCPASAATACAAQNGATTAPGPASARRNRPPRIRAHGPQTRPGAYVTSAVGQANPGIPQPQPEPGHAPAGARQSGALVHAALPLPATGRRTRLGG